jgi:hypothetical protein
MMSQWFSGRRCRLVGSVERRAAVDREQPERDLYTPGDLEYDAPGMLDNVSQTVDYVT